MDETLVHSHLKSFPMTLRSLAPALLAAVALSACGDRTQEVTVDGREAVEATPVSPGASGMPNFRTGLWEITDNAKGEMETRQECKSEGDKDLGLDAFDKLPEGCLLDRQPRAGGMRMTASCDQAGAKMIQTVDISGSETEIELHMTMTMQMPGQSPVRMTSIDGKGHWVGPCPAAQ